MFIEHHLNNIFLTIEDEHTIRNKFPDYDLVWYTGTLSPIYSKPLNSFSFKSLDEINRFCLDNKNILHSTGYFKRKNISEKKAFIKKKYNSNFEVKKKGYTLTKNSDGSFSRR